MRKRITDTQLETLDFVLGFIKKHRRRPTYREIQEKFDLKSVAAAYERMQRLESSIGACPWCQQPMPKEAD